MNRRATKEMVLVPRREFLRLKRVDRRFRVLLTYVRHLKDIRAARRDVRAGRVISQDRLFRSLGI